MAKHGSNPGHDLTVVAVAAASSWRTDRKPRRPSLMWHEKRKPRVKREIVAALARRILSGEIQPSEYLPKESELCAQYGVSRTVIREATKVLESKGLLRSRSRVGTRVLEASEWNMLDPDLLALASSDFHDPRFVDSLMEARRIIEPAAAELAARASWSPRSGGDGRCLSTDVRVVAARC